MQWKGKNIYGSILFFRYLIKLTGERGLLFAKILKGCEDGITLIIIIERISVNVYILHKSICKSGYLYGGKILNMDS